MTLNRDTIDLTDPDVLASHVGGLIDACEQHADTQKPERDAALEYYDGEMRDLPAPDGRSSAISQDARAVVKKLMPSLMRTFFANDRIVSYVPVGPGDEEAAEQASDYVNHVVVRAAGAERAVHDAIFDALVVKTGVLKWSAYKKRDVKVHAFTGQPEDALLGLTEEPDLEIFDHAVHDDPTSGARLHDFKVRRIDDSVDIRLEAVPRGAFLIEPGATDIETAAIVGERQTVTRSELVSRGYDRGVIDDLAAHDAEGDDSDDAMARRGDDWSDTRFVTSKALDEILLYEVYVRLDIDDDGVAELYKICLAEAGGDGGHALKTQREILEITLTDEAPYAAVVAERTAHQFEGRSIVEDVVDIQQIKTALLRETLNNIYWQNAKQPAIDPLKLTADGLEALYNPAFGKPITLQSGASIAEAVQWMDVPFVADKSFAMLAYLDEALKDRTGVTDASGGLDPEAFRTMTATSAQLLAESGIAQSEMIVRTLAQDGIRKAFRGLLRLVIGHADQPRTVRLRGQWITYDPRRWNADMDAVVNVGLGAGSRERDLAVLQLILNLQRELLSTIGPDNPYVKPEQLYNVLEKMTEAAGFPSAEPYFTRPDPQEIAAKLQSEGPSEAEQKMMLQAQVEQAKAQARVQVEEAQMAADLRVKEAELRMQAELETLKAASTRDIALMQAELALLKHREDLAFKREQAGLTPAPSEPFAAGDLYDGA